MKNKVSKQHKCGWGRNRWLHEALSPWSVQMTPKYTYITVRLKNKNLFDNLHDLRWGK